MALSAKGDVKFHLATLDGAGSWVNWCQQQGIQPFVLGKRDVDDKHGRFSFLTMLKLITLVRRESYDAVYIIGLRASLWLRMVKPWLAGACLVHGIRWNPNSHSLLDLGLCLTERLLCGLVDLYICNSRATHNTLHSRLGINENKILTIYNGLDKLPPNSRFLSERQPHVIVLANLNRRKGHFEFLEVVESVCKKITQAHFYFVGRDDMGGQLLTAIERKCLVNSVTLTGYQTDVSRWLNSSCLMVLPSLWGEGCPTSILEGYASGLPVVAYAIDGIPELINHQSDGILVAPGDHHGMANAIECLLLDLPLAAKFGEVGRKKVALNFTIENSASKHTQAFKKLLIDVV